MSLKNTGLIDNCLKLITVNEESASKKPSGHSQSVLVRKSSSTGFLENGSLHVLCANYYQQTKWFCCIRDTVTHTH